MNIEEVIDLALQPEPHLAPLPGQITPTRLTTTPLPEAAAASLHPELEPQAALEQPATGEPAAEAWALLSVVEEEIEGAATADDIADGLFPRLQHPLPVLLTSPASDLSSDGARDSGPEPSLIVVCKVPKRPTDSCKDWIAVDMSTRSMSGRSGGSGSETANGDYVNSPISPIKRMSRSFTYAAKSFQEAVLGDDELVCDRWEEREKERSVRAGSSSMRGSSSIRRSLSGNKVVAFSASQRTLSGTAISDIIQEKRATRTLLWYYGQTILYSAFVACFCLPIVAGLSAINWSSSTDPLILSNSTGTSSTGSNSTGAGDVPMSAITPNTTALQYMLLFQLIFPLCIYAIFLFVCIRKTFKIPLPLIIAVGVTVLWATVVCVLIRVYSISYWYYYIDLFMIVAAYVPCVCAVGWCIDGRPNATNMERLMDVLMIGALEILVAAATLIYCLFIMPNFFTLTSAWLQLLWLCVLHPFYFELTTGFIVRKVLYRNRQLGRTDVVYFLSIVHSMVHSVALATSLQASIEPIGILAISLTLYNASKLIWRSTVIPRDLFVERLFSGWSYNFSEEERADLARMVSVGVLTEIILENTSVIVSPFMLYRMYSEPIFMSVVPNTFFNNNGGYPVKTFLSLISVLFLFTVTFDLIFIFLNYYTTQRLPLINTWRRIKQAQLWYTLFLVYAFACMGVLFLFLTMLVLPRAAYCRSDSYCDCSSSTYDAICKGEYISMLVDYLVEYNGGM